MKQRFQGRIKRGLLGEFLVCADILRKGMLAIHIGNNGIVSGCADIILEEGVTVEVKTSIFKRGVKGASVGHKPKDGWGFAYLHRSHADVLALVMLEADQSVYKIVYSRRGDIGGRSMFYLRPDEKTPRGDRGLPPSETVLGSNWVTDITKIT
jgi:hypothetical protein